MCSEIFQRFAVLAPKISYYVTYDLYCNMITLRLSKATLTIQLLKFILNY